MASGVGGRWVVGWEEREKGGTEQGGMGEVAWLRGEEKDGTEECYHGDGRTIKQVNIVLLSLCETEFRNLSDIVFRPLPSKCC